MTCNVIRIFQNLLESMRTYASWTFALFPVSSKKENDKESNMSSLNYASYYFLWCFIMISFFNVLVPSCSLFWMCEQLVE